MKELQLWACEEALEATFEDIEELSTNCYFRDCRHENEPGCAIQEALVSGTLDSKRFRNYQKMQRELAYAERKKIEVFNRLKGKSGKT